MLGPLLSAAEGASRSEAATLGEANAAPSEIVGVPAAVDAAGDEAVPPAFFLAWNFLSCVQR